MRLRRFIKIGSLCIAIIAFVCIYGYTLDVFYPTVLPGVLISVPVLAGLFWLLWESDNLFDQPLAPHSPKSRIAVTLAVAAILVFPGAVIVWNPQGPVLKEVLESVSRFIIFVFPLYLFSRIRALMSQSATTDSAFNRFGWVILAAPGILLWASAIYLAARMPQIYALDPEDARHRANGLVFGVLGSSLTCSYALRLRRAQPQSGGPEADDGAFRPMRSEWNDIAILIGLIAVMAGSINFAISLRSLLTAHLPIVIALVVATCMMPVGGPIYLRQTVAARRDWQLQRQTTHMAPTARVESRGELYAWLLFLTGGSLQQVILVAHQFERGTSPQRIAFTLAVAVILLLLCGVALRHLDRSALGERR